MVDGAVWLGFMGTGTMIIVETGGTLKDDPALTVDAGLTTEIEAIGVVPLTVDPRLTAGTETDKAVPLAVEAGVIADIEATETVPLAVKVEL